MCKKEARKQPLDERAARVEEQSPGGREPHQEGGAKEPSSAPPSLTGNGAAVSAETGRVRPAYPGESKASESVCPLCNRPITDNMETAVRRIGGAIHNVHRACQGGEEKTRGE